MNLRGKTLLQSLHVRKHSCKIYSSHLTKFYIICPSIYIILLYPTILCPLDWPKKKKKEIGEMKQEKGEEKITLEKGLKPRWGGGYPKGDSSSRDKLKEKKNEVILNFMKCFNSTSFI